MKIKKIYNLRLDTENRPFSFIITKSLIWRATRKGIKLPIRLGDNFSLSQYQGSNLKNRVNRERI